MPFPTPDSLAGWGGPDQYGQDFGGTSQDVGLPHFYYRDPSTWTPTEQWAAAENQRAASSAGMSVEDYIRFQQTGQPPAGMTSQQTIAALTPWGEQRRDELNGGNWFSDTLGSTLTNSARVVNEAGEFIAENPAILLAGPLGLAAAGGYFGAGAAGAGAGGSGGGSSALTGVTLPSSVAPTGAVVGALGPSIPAGAGAAAIGPASGLFGSVGAGVAGAAAGASGGAASGAGGAAGAAGAAGGNFLENWLPTIAGGVNALLGYSASNQAADAESAAMQSAIDEQRRQFDTTRNDLMPWLTAGQGALNNLQNPQASFQASPGYQWARSEGQRDIGNSFAARGAGQSGNALRALSEFNTGLAQQDYGNWWNQQAGLAGVGQNTAVNLGGLGQNSAGNVGNYLAGQGQSRASGVMGKYGSLAQGLNDGVSNWLYRRRAA